jgi:glycosyltransferase involved in cell wall biosynthesis
MRTLIFIPAWNEEESVGEVIAGVRDALPDTDVLVIDDGSTDRTRDHALAAGALVASLPFNQGLGAALQTGYLYALREGYDFCAHLDGDGQHPPEEVVRVLEPVWSGEADLVIGSRYHSDAGAHEHRYRPTRSRRAGTALFGMLLSAVTRRRFTDITSGFRAANRRTMGLYVAQYSPDFAEIESLQRASRQGLRIGEVPVRMLPRASGHSFLGPLKSAFFVFKGLLVLAVGHFRPPVPEYHADELEALSPPIEVPPEEPVAATAEKR